MGVVTISDWTSKLAGTNGADYVLLSSADLFTGPASRHAVDANTVALWRGDGDWTDAGVGGYTLSPANNAALLTDQWMGGAMNFPAATDSASTTSAPSLYNQAMTLEGWFKPTSWLSGLQNFLYKAGSFQVFAYQSNLLCAYMNDSTKLHRRWWQLPSSLVGAWHHWAITWNGGYRTHRCWVDGSELTSMQYNTSITLSGNDNGNVVVGGGLVAVHDDVRLSNVVRYAGAFAPHRYEAATVRSGTGAVDSGGAASVWSSTTVTCPARTSNEVYALSVLASDSATTPASSDAGWVSVGVAQTGTATFTLIGLGLAAGRYLHYKWAFTPSTDSLQTYNIAVDTLAATYTPRSSGLRRFNAGLWTPGTNPGVM